MERKRKLPARATRSEHVSKKRTSTPPEQRTQTPTPAPQVVPESLPTSIAPSRPLPTIEEPQPENLSNRDFQTISESGVLADSLHRSRQKWLSEGIFERYWTKPTKKKGAPEQPANNPAKESMTKLGTCTITVEPHIFEATMYAIKDPTPRQIPPPSQQPAYRPIIQYGPPGGMMPPPLPTPPPVQAKPIPPSQPTPQQSPRSQDVHMANSGQLHSNNINSLGRSLHTNGSAPNGQHPSHTPANGAVVPAAAPAGKSTDPVIQMLAERAATDPNLKALMRIVANGEASPDELKQFQGHIDDLTRIQKAKEASQPPQTATQAAPPPPAVATPQNNGHTVSRPTPPPAPQVRATPPPPTPVQAPPYQPPPQPQALRSKGPVPNAKPDITGVVFEFTGGNGDRYSFPRFSILEYLPHGQVIASFLIVRKGSSSDSPSYDPDLDYYQPITIRLYAHQGRQLDALQKIVAPPEEVRRYMDDVMDKATRAEYVLLAMRLPKEKESTPIADREESEKMDQMNTQPLWATTHPTLVQHVKPAKKILTEEEQYHAFIATVS